MSRWWKAPTWAGVRSPTRCRSIPLTRGRARVDACSAARRPSGVDRKDSQLLAGGAARSAGQIGGTTPGGDESLSVPDQLIQRGAPRGEAGWPLDTLTHGGRPRHTGDPSGVDLAQRRAEMGLSRGRVRFSRVRTGFLTRAPSLAVAAGQGS